MKKQILLPLLLVVFNGFAQDFEMKKNHANIEFGGAGILYSINYERLLYNYNQHNFKASAGLGSIEDKLFLFEIGYFFGNKHGIELGGLVRSSVDFKNFYPSYRIGYRYQADSGFTLRIGHVPFFTENNNIFIDIIGPLYGGFSLGWRF